MKVYREMNNYWTLPSAVATVPTLAQYQVWSTQVPDQELNTIAMLVEVMMTAEWK